MKNYVLVHGAWGGSWAYDIVGKSLTREGNNVVALDLPGHGENKAEIADVTMNSYVQSVVNTISDLDGKVVLVGHSLAGAIISQVAELIPEKIDKLIFVAAMLLENGGTSLAVMQNDPHGELLPRTIFSEDGSYATINRETVRKVLLNDIKDEEYLESIIPNFLFKQPTQPFMAEARLSEENFGSVTKYYIRTSNDKVVSPSAQDKMLTNWSVDGVFTLNSGHFPLTSIPAELVKKIRSIG
jgi:pimeloyl-ACP methyl ester carboxylesterase